MGRAHAKALADVQDYQLVAVCDLEEDTARQAAAQTGAPGVFADYATMLAEVEPDVVAIATPTSSHAALTIEAAEAGARGVCCEKPMATNLGDARRMVEACREKGVALAVNHQRRMSEVYGTMRRLIEEGALGEVYLLRGSCAGDLLSDGTHAIDSFLHLVDDADAQWVFGQVHREAPDPSQDRGMGYHASGGWRYGHLVETGAMATFEFASGVRAELLTGDMRLPGRGYQDIEVSGAAGRLWRPGDQGDPPLWLWNGDTSGWRPVPVEDAAGRRSIADSYRALARTIRDGAPHPLGAENALRGFEIVMAVYESARLREKIVLPLRQDRFPLELVSEAD
jgi:predicted dehydrogenase